MDIGEARRILELALAVEDHIYAEDSEIWIQRLSERSAGIETALEALREAGDVEAALDLVGALSVFWQDIGRVDEGRKLTENLLQQVGSPERTRPLAKAHLVLGELAFRQGDQANSASATELAADVAEELGDRWLLGRATLNLARLAFRDGDAHRISAHAQRVLELAKDQPRLRSGAIHMLGWAEYTAGNIPGAIERFEENAALYHLAGDRMGEASELANLSDLSMESGNLDGAAGYLDRALSVGGVAENRYLAPSLIRSAGVLAGLQGRHELALELIAASDRIYEDLRLIADPGDDLMPRVRAQAIETLGAQADEVEARGRGRTFDEAFRAALTSLR